MNRSFVRLIVSSVLGCWVVGFLFLFTYGGGLSWVDERARRDGVFLLRRLLESEASEERSARLRELQPDFSVDFAIEPAEDVAERLGRRLQPGEALPLRVDGEHEWYFLAFEDGHSVLVAGPVNPRRPEGFLPIGVFLALGGLPLVAGLVALRIERQVRKVERASIAMAGGELSARVDNPDGPSKELAASFNAMAERVERLVRSRDELVQAVSHELGTPLARLRFHVALMDESNEADDDRTAAMTRELDALDELVAELLRYVQSDEFAIERRRFNPRQGLLDLAELAQLDGAGGVDVSVDLPAEFEVSADPRLFLRAIENLLRNAMQHAASRVRIEVRLYEKGAHVTVHDDGEGIPEDKRETVRSPFVRLQPERGRATGGVGLGLAIVSRIMEKHEGSLRIDDSPLGGAAIVTEWPAETA